LREFFPAALTAFPDLDAPDALELLRRAPDPDQAAQLTRSRITAALRRANRRDIDAKTTHLQATLRADQLRQPPMIQSAYAAIVASEVAIIDALNTQIDQLGAVVSDLDAQRRTGHVHRPARRLERAGVKLGHSTVLIRDDDSRAVRRERSGIQFWGQRRGETGPAKARPRPARYAITFPVSTSHSLTAIRPVIAHRADALERVQSLLGD
jgi:hypothetical protein